MKKSIAEFISDEINAILTFWLMKFLDLLGWCAIANIIRANILKLFDIKLGKNCRISTGVHIHNRLIPLEIGENTFINKNVYFDVGNAPVKIGKCCDIGFGVTIVNAKHTLKSNFTTRRLHEPNLPIIIEDYVWVGCNSTVLGGVTIGKGSVIAAGSVVVKDVLPNTVVAGVPAREIKKIIYEESNKYEKTEKNLIFN
ncbi:MAG: DapH/DapD/GlmU-related protein [Candidatus Gastranaerophilales bacterium]|nr:DapH/DapD/GlmU-related protein [Candidatus Gastranaerophilales bacterium]